MGSPSNPYGPESARNLARAAAAAAQQHKRQLASRRENLARANRVRLYRAELKRRLTRRELALRDVLLAGRGLENVGDTINLELTATMPIGEILPAVPGLGKVKVRAVMAGAGVRPTAELGRLTDRQRLEVLERASRKDRRAR
jgi:hypothetical protein